MSYLIDTNAWIALFEDSPILSGKAAVISRDPIFAEYGLKRVW